MNKQKKYIRSCASVYSHNRGITLIALIITIIVMLILAAVTISMAINGGLFEYASSARNQTIMAQEKEEIMIAWELLTLDKITGKIEEINSDYFVEKLNNNGNNTDVNDYQENKFLVEFKDTNNKYIVDENGNIGEYFNTNEISLPILDFENASSYNTTSFANNSNSLKGNYQIGFGEGREKLNVPIKNCIEGKIYKIRFSIQTLNAKFYNSYSYSYKISNTIYTDNNMSEYRYLLEKNAEETIYEVGFEATNDTMYLNFSMTDLKNGTYNILIDLKEITLITGVTQVYLDFENASSYNTTSFTNNSTLHNGDYKIDFGGGREKLNIPINNCTVGEIYTIKFSMQVLNAKFYNSYSYSYKISNIICTDNDLSSYEYLLEKNAKENIYEVSFEATSDTMYINFSMTDLKDGNYNFLITEILY